jgi:quercetin dioxygenase-like cupin family protein
MQTICALAILCGAAGASYLALAQAASKTAHTGARERARIAFSQALPKMNGDRLIATVLEVKYGPGESSSPHTHPCAVIGYVLEGSIRSQTRGEPEAIFKVGESFYEPPNGVHLVSGNASKTQSAAFLAYFVCDHNSPLSKDVPAPGRPGGK